MKYSDNLFELIKSMTPGEKRFFKSYSAMNLKEKKTAGYVRLFDAINKMTKYDEVELKKKHSGEKFIQNFSYQKNYLYNQLLCSLNTYGSDRNAEARIEQLLQSCDVLFEKGLVEQAKKLLEAAREIAHKFEKTELHLVVLKRLKSQLAEEHDSAGIKKIDDENNRTLDILKNENIFFEIHRQMYERTTTIGIVRNENDLLKFKELVSNKFLGNISSAMSYNSKKYFYDIWFMYYFCCVDMDKCYYVCKEQIKFLESRPELIEESPRNYIITLYRFLYMCCALIKEDDFREYFHKFRNIPVKSIEDKAKIFLPSYHVEINWYKNTFRYEKAEEIVRKIGNVMDTYKGKSRMNDQVALYMCFSISELFFLTANYPEALKWLNKIINVDEKEFDQEVYCFSKIFNLIIHFEIGNYDLLEYQLKSTYRFLHKRKRIFKFENLALDFIRNSFRITSEKELTALFEKLKYDLDKVMKDNFEKRILELFDLTSWLESKIEKRKYPELLREKASAAVNE